MNAYSLWQAIITGLVAFGAIVVTLWPPASFYAKFITAFVFAFFGVLAIWLQSLKDSDDKKIQNDLLNWQRGDPKNPPHIVCSPGVDPTDNVLKRLTFLMDNETEFPAYDVNGRVWDPENMRDLPKVLQMEDILARDIANVNIPALSPHTVGIVAKIEIPPDVTSKKFAAQYTTRAGGFSELIRMEKTDQATCHFAIRVTTADAKGEVLFEKVDPGFPLGSDGKVSW